MPFPTLPILDKMNRSESPLTGPGGHEWTHLPWGVHATTGTCFPSEGLSKGSARWNPEQFVEPAAQWAYGNNGTESHESEVGEGIRLWICLQGEAHSGYVAHFNESTPGSNKFQVKLEKWEGGVETVLHAFTAIAGLQESSESSEFGVWLSGGVLSAWVRNKGTWTEICKASDAKYIEGYSGVEITYEPNFNNFRSGVEESVTPTVTNPGTKHNTISKSLSYQVKATHTTKYFASGLPKGLVISESTGLITGTPEELETAHVKLTVKNEALEEATAEFEWIIEEVRAHKKNRTYMIL